MNSFSDNKMRVKQDEPVQVKQEPSEDMVSFTRKLCGLPPAAQGALQFYSGSPPQMIPSPSPSQGSIPLRSPVPSPALSPALTLAPEYGYHASTAPGYLTAGYSGTWHTSAPGPIHHSGHPAGEQGSRPQGSPQFGGLGPLGTTQEATVKEEYDSDDSCEFDDD